MGEHFEEPATIATIQETGAPAQAQTEPQAEAQTAGSIHNGCLEEPKTRKESGETGNPLKVQHQSNDTVSGLVSEQRFYYNRTGDWLAGCTKGVKLLCNSQDDVNGR